MYTRRLSVNVQPSTPLGTGAGETAPARGTRQDEGVHFEPEERLRQD